MNGASVYMSFMHQDKQTGGIAHQRTQKTFLVHLPLIGVHADMKLKPLWRAETELDSS